MPPRRLFARFRRRTCQLDRIEALLRIIISKEERSMATLEDVKAAVATLTAHATDLSNAVKTAMTTLDSIAAQLNAALASNDPVALQAIVDQVNLVAAESAADNTALLARVAADTPAVGAAPATPVDAAPATDAPAAPQA